MGDCGWGNRQGTTIHPRATTDHGTCMVAVMQVASGRRLSASVAGGKYENTI